ncbi:hypothetical protein [Paracidobacterium acidisoli]|uniref:Uncharacterized protein n=1 Tax=Paracidobacterium acidisoli TaxID=2303751 RepID=A0A372ILM6_9BACT|nr:hypothetical protein [Paracidobacterium acidisoli]MBT9332461.1 hypothetical protein [Paracidobacterium acidisoli]
MGCCGKARANLSYSRSVAVATPAAAANPAASASWPSGSAPRQLRYTGQAGIVVRGPVTGKPYTFNAQDQVQTVDPRDAAVLLRTQYFRQG